MLSYLWPATTPTAPNMLMQVEQDINKEAAAARGAPSGAAAAMEEEEFAQALQVPVDSLNYSFDDEFQLHLTRGAEMASAKEGPSVVPSSEAAAAEATAAKRAKRAKRDAVSAEAGDVENQVTTLAASGSQSTEVKSWDINSGARKDGLWQVTMVLPAVTHLATNVVGATLASGGYAMGKVGELAGAGKAVDSTVFQAGFFAWLRCNGIFPSVKYEPWQFEADRLKSKFGLSGPLTEDDMKVTPIIVSNHVSYLDGLVLAALFHAPRIVAKQDT